jgi:poly-gamma-glutamate capsule biosynthesis protein CapA/YwtB (metallophosphatase superfamily)
MTARSSQKHHSSRFLNEPKAHRPTSKLCGRPMTARSQKLDSRSGALMALAAALLIAMTVAWRVDAGASAAPPTQIYQLRVVGETGEPVAGAVLSSSSIETATDAAGWAQLELQSPELVIVAAVGSIPDAVVVGSPDTPIATLQLLDVSGPGGERTVMHFAGDFMMGRRYVEPTRSGTPVVNDEAAARAVVADIAPLFSLADLVSVNYESVIGTLDIADAYQGKRFLLRSAPETIAALDELGVNLATLGNNHVNDWRATGLASTIRHLGAAGIAHPGGGVTASDALQPVVVPAGQLKVGVISMTTVTGDYVNDHLPGASAPMPAAVAPQDEWQYEARAFGFGEPSDPNYVESRNRRPRAMWDLYKQLEPDLAAADAAELWPAVSGIYPELQDWVARRGHGGAAHYSHDAVEKGVATARSAGADLVVVQLHGGLQFAETSSSFFREAARTAVDAGADLVIGHHPHVVQGFEFYNDTLIAYSLGNIVFDQDFLVTHASIVLRTVFEGDDLVAATVYPVMLDNYRPVAVGGEVAARIIRQVNEASIQAAESIRLPDLRVGSSPAVIPVTASVIDDSGRGRIVPTTDPTQIRVEFDGARPAKVAPALIAIGESTSGLLIGRDIFGYGDLEDVQADAATRGGLEWSLPATSLEIDETSPAGPWTARLDRASRHESDTVARTAARVPMPAHRWFNDEGLPIDGNATYSVRVWARREGAGIPFVRVSYYEFDDTDPTRQPESKAVETIDVQLPVANDGLWHELWVDLPLPPNAANSALVGVGLAPPESQSGTVWIDGLDVVEWRRADQIPDGTWVPADYVQGPAGGAVTLTAR